MSRARYTEVLERGLFSALPSILGSTCKCMQLMYVTNYMSCSEAKGPRMCMHAGVRAVWTHSLIESVHEVTIYEVPRARRLSLSWRNLTALDHRRLKLKAVNISMFGCHRTRVGN